MDDNTKAEIVAAQLIYARRYEHWMQRRAIALSSDEQLKAATRQLEAARHVLNQLGADASSLDDALGVSPKPWAEHAQEGS